MENKFVPSEKMFPFILDGLKLLIDNYQTKIQKLEVKQEDERSELENDLGFVRAILSGLETQKNQRSEDSILISLKDFYLFKQSLNEICGGAYAIPNEEFQTLVGTSKDEAIEILNKIKFPESQNLTFKYQIFHDKNDSCYILQPYSMEYSKNWEKLLTFEATDYDEATKIYNKFLD